MNVMWSSRLFRVSLFLENASILMIWGCFSIVSNVIRPNYCCRRHTMHGNMVFSRDSIFPTPQQSGCLCVCSVESDFRSSKMATDNHIIYKKNIYLKRSKVIFGHPKWPKSDFQNGRRWPFKKKKMLHIAIL